MIVLIPDHCLSIYFDVLIHNYKSVHYNIDGNSQSDEMQK